MEGNTYIQKLGLSLGQYGANETFEPANEVFDENAEKWIDSVLKDTGAKVYYIVD
jgi:hypothetical protein